MHFTCAHRQVRCHSPLVVRPYESPCCRRYCPMQVCQTLPNLQRLSFASTNFKSECVPSLVEMVQGLSAATASHRLSLGE